MRLGYWHFAYLGPESQTAGEASECAADQGAFWIFHDHILVKQTQGLPLEAENLKLYAAELGLDQSRFDTCLDSGRHTEFIQSQTAIAQQIGVGSTPAYLINSQALSGWQTFENFQRLIEGELAK